MGKKKTEQKQNTQMTYNYSAPLPTTPDVQQYREAVQQPADFSTPLIHSYARAGEGIENQIFEHDLNPAVRDQIKRSQLFNLQQERGNALSQAKMQEHAYKTGNLGQLAQFTAPKLVQTGGSATGTTTEGGSAMWLQPLIGGAATVAGGALS